MGTLHSEGRGRYGAPVWEEAVLVVQSHGQCVEACDRLTEGGPHQVTGEVVSNGQICAYEVPGGETPGRDDPALAMRDAGNRHLLGEVVQLVPRVVSAVSRGIGYLSEREEPGLDASGARTGSVRRGHRETTY
jgi:hypothetical protein